jgi:hypothetical protein
MIKPNCSRAVLPASSDVVLTVAEADPPHTLSGLLILAISHGMARLRSWRTSARARSNHCHGDQSASYHQRLPPAVPEGPRLFPFVAHCEMPSALMQTRIQAPLGRPIQYV